MIEFKNNFETDGNSNPTLKGLNNISGALFFSKANSISVPSGN